MDIREAWAAHRGRPIMKSSQYPDAHERHFARFQGTAVTVVEIGVLWGGSLQLWKSYFGPAARIVGVDINPACKAFEEDQIEIVIGYQGDREFLEQLAADVGPIDVLIDDGGHTMAQQHLTFDVLFPLVSGRGVYVCEDSSSSYRPEFGGGLRHPDSFVETMKRRVDDLNAWYSADATFEPTDFTRTAASIHFYAGLVVIEKAPTDEPQFMLSKDGGVTYGTMERPPLGGANVDVPDDRDRRDSGG
jgi:cephalosporin hydroxylase